MAQHVQQNLSGIELEREFLKSMQRWRHLSDQLIRLDVDQMSDNDVSRMIADLISLDGNLNQMYDQIMGGEYRHADHP
jgi:hypothetical protein